MAIHEIFPVVKFRPYRPAKSDETKSKKVNLKLVLKSVVNCDWNFAGNCWIEIVQNPQSPAWLSFPSTYHTTQCSFAFIHCDNFLLKHYDIFHALKQQVTMKLSLVLRVIWEKKSCSGAFCAFCYRSCSGGVRAVGGSYEGLHYSLRTRFFPYTIVSSIIISLTKRGPMYFNNAFSNSCFYGLLSDEIWEHKPTIKLLLLFSFTLRHFHANV